MSAPKNGRAWRFACALLLAAAAATAWAQTATKTTPDLIRAATAKVDGAMIVANERSTRDWPSYGLDYAETRFSKLKQINADNVGKLGLVWSYNLESNRGVEATPVVIDGVMYVTASWSIVHAIDVRTGQKLWSFDPKVDRAFGYKGCCDVVNRGVAVWKGKVFVASYDGRLFGLDAATGNKLWETGHDHRSQDVLHHHRCAARLQGQGDHRQRRRRVRRARLHHRLRRRHRRAEMALVHRARRPEQALRGHLDGARRADLGRVVQVLGSSAAAAPPGTRWPSTPS